MPSCTELTVADNGPGIAKDYRQKVFQRFYRLEQSRTTPGNGLGLSIVGAIAELHEGTLTLSDNKPGLKVVLSLQGK
jgi:signal transduction histidine kinase